MCDASNLTEDFVTNTFCDDLDVFLLDADSFHLSDCNLAIALSELDSLPVSEDDVESLIQVEADLPVQGENHFGVVRKRDGVYLVTPEHIRGMQLTQNQVKAHSLSSEQVLEVRTEDYLQEGLKFVGECSFEASRLPYDISDEVFSILDAVEEYQLALQNLEKSFSGLQVALQKSCLLLPSSFVKMNGIGVSSRRLKSYTLQKYKHKLDTVRKEKVAKVERNIPTQKKDTTQSQFPISNFIG